MFNSRALALLKSLLLHGVLAGLLFVTWNKSATMPMKPNPIPNYIKAEVVEKPKPKPVAKPQPKPQPKPKPKPKSEPKPAPKPVPKPKPATKPTAKPKPVQKPVTKPAPKPVPKPAPRPVINDELMSELMEEEELIEQQQVEEAKIAEQEAQQQRQIEMTEVEKYAAFIRDKVTRNWSRPPSARNGMQVKLQIQMIPGGEVTSVSIIESSGNDAFDRSAMNAVQQAGIFEVPKNPVTFDRYFRKFVLIFRPEDLRL